MASDKPHFKRRLVVPPRPSRTIPGMEFRVVQCSTLFRATDVETVFPELTAAHLQGVPLFALSTFQALKPWEEATGCSAASMIDYGDGAPVFKDESRDAFVALITRLREKLPHLSPEGCPYWVDCPDPATGLPMNGPTGPSPYSEADGVEQLLLFELVHVGTSGGGCRMVSHPTMGLQSYPATAFIAAPEDVMLRLIEEV